MDVSIFLALGATVTKAVDFIRNSFDPKGVAPKFVWNVVAFGLGIAGAWASAVNIMPGQRGGTIITGLAVGASASGFHEVFDFFSAKAKGVS